MEHVKAKLSFRFRYQLHTTTKPPTSLLAFNPILPSRPNGNVVPPLERGSAPFRVSFGLLEETCHLQAEASQVFDLVR